MAQTQKKQQDMGTGDVKKLLLQLMIPAVVAQVVNLLYNIVDRIYIGHIPGIGAAALTGVGLFTPILMLLNAFAMLIGSGGAPRTAMGQGDKKQAEKIVSNSFTMLLLFSVVLTIVFYAAAPTLLRLFGASDTTLPYALTYSRIYILGTICVLIVLGMNTFITAQGFAKISMLTTVIGAGININRANGNLVVDIGGGTTDVAVISLGGIVESTSIKVAGDKFDEAIVKYVRRKHNALIGDRTAEEIKRTVGCVYPRSEEAIMEVRGRCLMTGLPRTFTVSSSEILDALEEVSSAIVEAVHWVLERTPPELTGDISANGITMTGGGSLIWGFDKLIASKTGIPTRVADEAVSCVAYGTGNCLENLSKMQDGTMNLSRQRQMKAR